MLYCGVLPFVTKVWGQSETLVHIFVPARGVSNFLSGDAIAKPRYICLQGGLSMSQWYIWRCVMYTMVNMDIYESLCILDYGHLWIYGLWWYCMILLYTRVQGHAQWSHIRLTKCVGNRTMTKSRDSRRLADVSWLIPNLSSISWEECQRMQRLSVRHTVCEQQVLMHSSIVIS